MTKLKTLKDLVDEHGVELCAEYLQQEAIKWKKKFGSHIPARDCWVCEFFNLTEDDLK